MMMQEDEEEPWNGQRHRSSSSPPRPEVAAESASVSTSVVLYASGLNLSGETNMNTSYDTSANDSGSHSLARPRAAKHRFVTSFLLGAVSLGLSAAGLGMMYSAKTSAAENGEADATPDFSSLQFLPNNPEWMEAELTDPTTVPPLKQHDATGGILEDEGDDDDAKDVIISANDIVQDGDGDEGDDEDDTDGPTSSPVLDSTSTEATVAEEVAATTTAYLAFIPEDAENGDDVDEWILMDGDASATEAPNVTAAVASTTAATTSAPAMTMMMAQESQFLLDGEDDDVASLTLTPVESTWLEFNSSKVMGDKKRLKVDDKPQRITLLKFDMSPLSDAGVKSEDVTGATLRMYSLTDSDYGGLVEVFSHACSLQWDEGNVSWANAPRCAFRNSTRLMELSPGNFSGPIEAWSWNEAALDFKTTVTVKRFMTLRITSIQENGVTYASQHNETAVPELVVHYRQDMAETSTTAATTADSTAAAIASASPVCPQSLNESYSIDTQATLYYAMVPSNPPGSNNGLFCARLEVADHDGWVALGVSVDDEGSMYGSEAVVGLPSDGSVLKYGLFSRAVVMPGSRQTLMDTSLVQEDDKTTMSFTKFLVEKGELPIGEDESVFLFARGGERLGYHDVRSSFKLSFEAATLDTSTSSMVAQETQFLLDGVPTDEDLASGNFTSLSLTPIEDTWLEFNDTDVYGEKMRLKVDGEPTRTTLLKFDMSELVDSNIIESEEVVGVKLRLYSLTDSDYGGRVERLGNACSLQWDELEVSWDNAHGCVFQNSSRLENLSEMQGPIKAWTWNEATLKFQSPVPVEGLLTLRITSAVENGVTYASRHNETASPELVVYYRQDIAETSATPATTVESTAAAIASASPVCPPTLDKSRAIDPQATLYYAMVPSNPSGSSNGLFCARLEVSDHDGWVALGFSADDDGTMYGSDAVLGLPSDGSVFKYELFWTPDVMPESNQTLMGTSLIQEDDKTILSFTKLLVEEGEVPIGEEESVFLHARGGERLGYHEERSSFKLSFVTEAPTASPSLEPTLPWPTYSPTIGPSALTRLNIPVSHDAMLRSGEFQYDRFGMDPFMSLQGNHRKVVLEFDVSETKPGWEYRYSLRLYVTYVGASTPTHVLASHITTPGFTWDESTASWSSFGEPETEAIGWFSVHGSDSETLVEVPLGQLPNNNGRIMLVLENLHSQENKLDFQSREYASAFGVDDTSAKPPTLVAIPQL
ncbi:hypothetical protein ACHAWF_016888 [Thalassiosira exigua]